MNDRTLSRKCTQPSSSSSSSSPCPVLSRAPASCSARCCAPTLKSRRNPVRLSAAAAPEPQGARGGRRKVLSPLDRIGPQWLFLLVPTGEPKLVYLTGKSQPTKLDKQRDLRLRKNTAQNKLLFLPAGRPVSDSESAPPVCHRLARPGGGAPTNSGAPMTEPQGAQRVSRTMKVDWRLKTQRTEAHTQNTVYFLQVFINSSFL